MANGQHWKCTNCGYEIGTSSSHEFYRDNNGTRKVYGHPMPFSEEAEKAGVKGFFMVGYCPKCKEIREAITQEFGDPVVNDNHWIRSFDDDCKSFEPLCDKCGTLLKRELNNTDVCPKCNDGVFIESDGWIS